MTFSLNTSDKPKTDTCKCGKTYTIAYDYRTGIRKNKECPSCTYSKAYKKNSKKQESSFISKKKDSKGTIKKKKVKIPNTSKKLDKKLDDAWLLLVKLRAGMKCEYCGKKTTLNSHHIFSRSNKSVRWDTMDGICLCVKHHTFDPLFSAHKGSVAFNKWLREYKGEEFMNKLENRANITSHYSISEKQIILDELLKEIKLLQNT